MAADDKKPFTLSVNLSQAEALAFLEELANPDSALRQGLVEGDARRLLADYNIVVGDEDLRDIVLPSPEKIQWLISDVTAHQGNGDPPTMDGRCRGWAVAFAAGGTAQDEEE